MPLRISPTMPLGVALALAASACAPTVADLPTPGVVATRWDAGSPAAAATIGPDGFWQAMGDPALDAFIARGLAHNVSLDIALARVDQARAAARLARAALLPDVSANGGLTARRLNDFNTAQYSSAPASAGIDVAWTLDLFGGARAGRRAAIDRYRAARLDAATAALLTEVEVARTFIQIAALDDRDVVLGRSIGNARETLRIVDLRIAEGMTMAGERGVQLVEVNRLAAQRVQLRQARSTAVSALAVLVGAEAPGFTVPPVSLMRLRVPALALVQPAELLVRRPDVAAAEARIAAARGDIRQARAAFLPTLRLSASGLAQAVGLGGPLGTTLSAGAGLVAPIFAGGALRARLDTTVAQRAEIVGDYRRTMLGALKDAVDGLAAQAGAEERYRLFAATLAAARGASRVARDRYAEGEGDLPALLDADRGVLAAEDGVVLAAQDRLSAAVDRYAAMGGRPDLSSDGPLRR